MASPASLAVEQGLEKDFLLISLLPGGAGLSARHHTLLPELNPFSDPLNGCDMLRELVPTFALSTARSRRSSAAAIAPSRRA